MTLLFSFPDQTSLGHKLEMEVGAWEWRHFPDGESYVRVLTDVRGKAVTILCSLNQPDSKTQPLIFLARTLKDLGADRVTLIAPYLGYMRQDKRFKSGEAITSEIYAGMLSAYIDELVNVDPHLHRHHRLQEIYDCECKTVSTTPLMAEWVKNNIPRAIIIGPDRESEQWVKAVAESASVPYVILEKTRLGDQVVDIVLPNIDRYRDYTPVLVDDIVSTAATMIRTVEILRPHGFESITCLATHAVFAGDAYLLLKKAGVTNIVTTNTIRHPSNVLEIAGLFRGQVH